MNNRDEIINDLTEIVNTTDHLKLNTLRQAERLLAFFTELKEKDDDGKTKRES